MPIHATLIAENYAGHLSQGKGLAERAGFSWDFQPVIFRKKGLIPRLVFRSGFQTLRQIEPVILTPQTEIIISMAGKGSRVAALLGKRYNLPVIQIQDPRMSVRDFSLVIVNEHDRLRGDKVVTIRTALHGVTEEKLSQARQKWKPVIRQTNRRILGVLLGGTNGRYVFEEREAAKLSEQIRDFIILHQMECIITSSRRTSEKALFLMKTFLQPYGVRFLSGEGEENPYLGILACSDCLAVTEDSVSMISEAVATSCPVGILPLSGHSGRLRSFVEGLQEVGRVVAFDKNMPLLPMEKLDDTPLAVERIKQKLKC
ncbi:mitochondrial fission ELM1 family protein [Acetobacteraceae bacterium ESL0709]|nr:mitochondrial fission ELM1 family protein [Acetobacteraceae bacterium ESL0697]MDF7677950.1 mitochondrial fission ELM1 family protein [Acetobacteraceae bacterium ESL0709]